MRDIADGVDRLGISRTMDKSGHEADPTVISRTLGVRALKLGAGLVISRTRSGLAVSPGVEVSRRRRPASAVGSMKAVVQVPARPPHHGGPVCHPARQVQKHGKAGGAFDMRTDRQVPGRGGRGLGAISGCFALRSSGVSDDL